MGKNYMGDQVNHTSTIVEKAGADIADCRNRIMKYDEQGDVVLATAGTDLPLGIAIIEAGYNDISGAESGKAKKGDDVDILIKDIGYVIAGAEIARGKEVAAGADGKAAVAKEGDFVIGIALNSVSENGYCRVLISRYAKGGSGSSVAEKPKLAELTDVQISQAEDKQVLTYESSSQKWVNKNAESEAV